MGLVGFSVATYCVVEPEGVTLPPVYNEGEFSQLLVVSHEAEVHSKLNEMDEEHKNRLVNFIKSLALSGAYKALGLQNYPLLLDEPSEGDVKKGSKAQRIIFNMMFRLTDGDLDYTFPVRLKDHEELVPNRYIEMVWAYPMQVIPCDLTEKGLLRRYFYAAITRIMDLMQAELLKEHHHARLIINAVSPRERFRQMEGAIARLAELEKEVVVRELLNRREAKLDAYTSAERFQKGYEHLVSEMNISVNNRQANELERETTQLQQTKEAIKIEHIRSQLDGANRRLIEYREREWQEAVAAVGNVDGALSQTEELDSAMMYLRQSAKLATAQELDIFTTARDRYGAIARAFREIVMSYSNHPVVGLFFRKLDSLLRDRKEIEEDVRSLRTIEIEKAINDNEGWKKQLKDEMEVDCPQCNHRFRPGIRKSLPRCENVLHGLYHDRQHFLETALEKRLQGMDLTSAGLSEKLQWNLPLSMHLDQLKTTDRLGAFEGTRIDVDSIQNALNDACNIDSLKQELATFQQNWMFPALLDEESRQAYLMRNHTGLKQTEQAASAETECNMYNKELSQLGVLPSDELINEFQSRVVAWRSIRKRIASLQPAVKLIMERYQELNRTIEARPGLDNAVSVDDDEEDRARLEVRLKELDTELLSGAIEHTGRKIGEAKMRVVESDLTYVVGCYRRLRKLASSETLLTDATTEVRRKWFTLMSNSMVEQLTGITKEIKELINGSIFNITKGVSIVDSVNAKVYLVGDDRLKFEVLRRGSSLSCLPLAPAKSEFREGGSYTNYATVTIILGGNGCGKTSLLSVFKGFTGMGLHEIETFDFTLKSERLILSH
ncbi:hypothetical protein SPFM1_00093 [Salmonella phage SPFM1]|nr:hypothetical protein SPFM1_00093 [Salmonella phage SPFM1]